MPRLRLALFGVLLLSVFAMSVTLLLRMNAALEEQTALSPPPQLFDHYEAILPGDMRVELVGLAPMENDPQRWWKPDGTVLSPHPILEPVHRGLTYQEGAEMRRALVLVHGVGDYKQATSHMSGSKAVQTLPTGETCVSYSGGLVVRPGKLESQVRVGVATEPLSPTRILDPQGHRLPATADVPPDPIREDIVVTQVKKSSVLGPLVNGGSQSQGQTELTYELPIRWRQPDLHIVAIDRAGLPHQVAGSGGSFPTAADSKSPGMATGILFFPLPPAQIDRFEYQFRLYRYWVTFENVSLEPDRITNVKVSVDPDPGEQPLLSSP